jgi:hypothetical protein
MNVWEPGRREFFVIGVAIPIRCTGIFLAVSLVLLGLLMAAADPTSAAAASPRWQIQLYGQPTNFDPASDEDMYFAHITNVGDAPTDGTNVTITDSLSEGVTATGVQLYVSSGDLASLLCPMTTGPLVQCEFPGEHGGILPKLQPGEGFNLLIRVAVAPGTEGPLRDSVFVSGGGAPDAAASTAANQVSATPAPPGFQEFQVSALNQYGTPYTEAGGHPYELSVTGYLNTRLDRVRPVEGKEPLALPVENAKDLVLDLPPGLIANPRATTRCTLASFWSSSCPISSQVGTISITIAFGHNGITGYRASEPFYNLEPEFGSAAAFGFLVSGGIPFVLNSGVRTGSDYGIRTKQEGIPGVLLTSFSLHLWGTPADASHNRQRGQECIESPTASCGGGGLASTDLSHPFLTLPVDCTVPALTAEVAADSWEHPGLFHSRETSFPAPDGCNSVPFSATVEARPTTNAADSPSGLDLDIHVPQHEGAKETVSSQVEDTRLVLPEGIRLNPAAANGLGSCSESEIGYIVDSSAPVEFTPGPASCPDSAKLGTVEIASPLLAHPLPDPGEGLGAIYLAKPFDNPFHSLLALYLVVEDEPSGTIIKIPGEVTPDAQTGQLTASFRELPQLPFEDFRLHFFSGAEGLLRTPTVCGAYGSQAVLTPWSAPESGPPLHLEDQFAIGGNCAISEAAAPDYPRFHAGTERPQAGMYSPLRIRLVREDGEQGLGSFDFTLPPGLTANLSGIPYCPEAAIAAAAGRSGAEEQATPSCSSASEVGTVEVGAGTGPTPVYVQGHVYLAGPYKGAPISFVFITPVVAGPFDLGTTVVRAAISLDPETVQSHVVSDHLPSVLHGIQLDIRSVTVKLDRHHFTLNPTSCEEFNIAGNATSLFGVGAPLSTRFQVGSCAALGFRPRLRLSLSGGVHRNSDPRLRAMVTFPKGGTHSNIAKAAVTLPATELLENAHIKDVCSPAEYAEGGGGGRLCPPGSVYGYARAWTPLLEEPLEGPVFLRSNPEHELPDLVASLGGQIQVDLQDRIDTAGGRIRNTFEAVPDTPISRFELQMAGGRKSLLVNTADLCQAKPHATAAFTAHDGARREMTPAVKVSGCAPHRKRRGHHGHRRRFAD